MIVEMHCHTSEYSTCSHVAAADMVQHACKVGIQTIVITDHHYLWSADEILNLRARSNVPEIFTILAGQEVGTKDFGHILIYGASETIERNDKMTVREIRRHYPDAAIIWAHPYRDGRIPQAEKLLDPLLDGIEIFSSNYSISEALHALTDWHQHKFIAIAGSDTHAYSYVGIYPTIFDHPITSIEALTEEIKAGHCRPYFKEIPRMGGTSRTSVKEVTIGPKSADSRKKLVVKTFSDPESWKTGERAYYIDEQLYKNGFNTGPYRVPEPLDRDDHLLTTAEERIKGPSLAEAMIDAPKVKARNYLVQAAEWLVKLHNAKLQITPRDEYLKIEPERLQFYLKPLIEGKHPHLERVRQIHDSVLEKEKMLIHSRPEILIQGHGDYHPRNIYISREDADDWEYMSVIDFGSSYQLPRAFDVATFMSQYVNIFFDHRNVQKNAPAELFWETYLDETDDLDADFYEQVELYKARTCLSILYYLNKVGMGDSENFWRILVEAEKSLATLNFHSF